MQTMRNVSYVAFMPALDMKRMTRHAVSFENPTSIYKSKTIKNTGKICNNIKRVYLVCDCASFNLCSSPHGVNYVLMKLLQVHLGKVLNLGRFYAPKLDACKRHHVARHNMSMFQYQPELRRNFQILLQRERHTHHFQGLQFSQPSVVASASLMCHISESIPKICIPDIYCEVSQGNSIQSPQTFQKNAL
ncbi:Histidine--tRNA ligase [Frankliniella fusca]|uniref:Histidine--tRNA ligase n=1 Tax=Frankliniella fusca TaxID=407009 RepID=A0AAE1LCD6_9NEOP|nr:Histidine--tRNA ligase [Frankliniella fusca]